MSFTLRGRTSQYILTYISNGADARTVRPYMLVMAILMCKMVEMASCANACRDARSVRPLKMPRAFAPTTMLFACNSLYAGARTNVYRLTIPTERTHGLRLLEGRLQQKNAHGLREAGRVVMGFGVRSGRLWLVGPRAWTARTLVRRALCAHLAQVTAQFLREFCHK